MFDKNSQGIAIGKKRGGFGKSEGNSSQGEELP
jgi:hypothetical protein